MAQRLGGSLTDLLNNNTTIQQNTQQLLPTTTPEQATGILPAIKRSAAGGFTGLGRFAQETNLPGAEGLTNYGQQLSREAGPAPVSNIEDIAAHPGAAIQEGLGAGAGSMIPTVAASAAGNVAGGLVGGALGSVVPVVGTAAGAELGRRIGGGLARAAVNIPTYIGSNLQRQDETGQHDFGKAILGGLTQAGVEELETQALGGILPAGFSKKLGLDAAAKVMGHEGFSGGVVSRAVKGALVAGATNAAEEYTQQQIERAQAGLDVGSQEAIREGAFNAALGAIAGAGLGAGAGALNQKQVTKIPGLDQEFTNKDIENTYRRIDELYAQKKDLESKGQDISGLDTNLQELANHLQSTYISPTVEGGKKASVKPVEKQEAEAVHQFLNKLNESEKTSQEPTDIQLEGLTPLQEYSKEQFKTAQDNAKARIKELVSIGKERGKFSPDEKSELDYLKNTLKSGNKESLVNWHEKMFKPQEELKTSQLPTYQVEELNQIPPTAEEITIPDISPNRFANESSTEFLNMSDEIPRTESIDIQGLTPLQEAFQQTTQPVEELVGKQVNPVRETILNKEDRVNQEVFKNASIAETKAFKSKAPATRLLRKLNLQDSHEVIETAPKEFKVVPKQTQETPVVAEEVGRLPTYEVQELPREDTGLVLKPGSMFREQAGTTPTTEDTEALRDEDIKIFKNNMAFSVQKPGMEVSEITDPEMVKAIMSKHFGGPKVDLTSGKKQTINLSDFNPEQATKTFSNKIQKIKEVVENLAAKLKDSDVKIIYVDKVSDIKDDSQRRMAERHQNGGTIVAGMFDKRKNTVYVVGQGNRSPQEAIGTVFHELVGHYGMRKILGKKWDNYLERLLDTTDLSKKIYSLGEQWHMYLKDYPASKYDTYTWKNVRDSEGQPIVTSKTAATKLADEYIAELARLFTSSGVVDKYGLRTKENRSFITKVIDYIKHLFRGQGFGEASSKLTEEDVMKELAKSYDSLFVRNNFKVDSIEKLNSNPKEVYKGEDQQDVYDYQYAVQNQAQQQSLFNLEEQGFGRTNFDEKTRSWDRVTNWLAHKPLAANFPHLGTLQYQNQLLRLYNKSRGQTTLIEKLTREIREKFSDFNKVQKLKMYEFLTTANYDRSKLHGIISDEVVQLAQDAKDQISLYGETLTKLGKLDPLTYEQNKDAYLRTRYAKYLMEYKGSGKIGSYQNYLRAKKDLTESDKAGLLEIKDPQFLLIDTLGTIGRDTTLLGTLHNISALSEKENLGWVIDDPTLMSADGTSMTLEEAKEHLKKQQDNIKDQGEALGYDNQKVQLLVQEADSLQQRITDAYNRLDAKIAQFSQQQGLGSSMSPKEYADTYYKKLPKGKQYGKLSGMYVRKEIYDDLREGIDAFYNLNTQGKILKTMETVHRLWKTSKVSWNIPTWFQNGFGNFGLLDLASPTNMGTLGQMTAQEIYGAATGKQSKYWTLGQENGVFGTTLAANELYTNEAEYRLKLKKLGDINSGNKFADSWDHMKNLFLTLNEKTSNWYGLLEGTFKVVALRDHIQRWEKESGLQFDDLQGNEREAVIASAIRFANDALFDYSAVPNWVKQIRRFPLGSPFITFSYKALPAIMKALRYNPKKFIKYAIMPSLMMQMFLMANPDLDEEDYEEILAKQPYYMKDKSSMYLLPNKDSNGKWQFWDMGYLLPWSPFVNWGLYVKNHFDAMNYETTAESTVEAGYELLTNTFGVLGGPVPQLISLWKTGTDPYTKEPVFTEGQPASEKWWKAMSFTTSMMAPSWLTGQGFAGKLQDALGTDLGPLEAEPLNRYGTKKGTPLQAFEGLAGLKVKGVSPQESHLSNLKMFEVEEQKIKKAKSQALKNPNQDPIKRLETIKKYNELLINQRRKRSEYLRSIQPSQ